MAKLGSGWGIWNGLLEQIVDAKLKAIPIITCRQC